MVTDIALWTPPAPPIRYDGKGADAVRADVTGHSAGEAFTDADYVPVVTYSRTVGGATAVSRSALAIVSGVNERTATHFGRAHAAIELYNSIFNYQYRPAAALSIYV